MQSSKKKNPLWPISMQFSKIKDQFWPITMQFSKIKQPVSIYNCAKNLPWISSSLLILSEITCQFFENLQKNQWLFCSEIFKSPESAGYNKIKEVPNTGRYWLPCSSLQWQYLHLWLTLASGWVYPKFLCATTTKLDFNSHFDSLLQKLWKIVCVCVFWRISESVIITANTEKQ
jgi:hypothetical protein